MKKKKKRLTGKKKKKLLSLLPWSQIHAGGSALQIRKASQIQAQEHFLGQDHSYQLPWEKPELDLLFSQ